MIDAFAWFVETVFFKPDVAFKQCYFPVGGDSPGVSVLEISTFENGFLTIVLDLACRTGINIIATVNCTQYSSSVGGDWARLRVANISIWFSELLF